jgi:hypothetical protein
MMCAMTSRLLLGVLLASVAAVSAGLAHLRQRHLQPPPGLIYEEEEPGGRMFEGFKLSEGLAAESPASGATGAGASLSGTPMRMPVNAITESGNAIAES